MTTTAEPVIDTVDGPMPALEAWPSDAAKGGIVVVHEAFGLTSHIHAIVERLAAAGWHALAPALFHRHGSPVIAYDNYNSVKPILEQLTAEAIEVDLGAAFDHLRGAGFDARRSGVIGFCMGGNLSFHAATTRALGAAVTFYGGGVAKGRFGLPCLIDQAPALKTPWLGLYGDLDQSIPTEDVERLRDIVERTSVGGEIVRYPDAGHGFNCDDRPEAFNAAAASDAWQRSLAWFDALLAPPHAQT